MATIERARLRRDEHRHQRRPRPAAVDHRTPVEASSVTRALTLGSVVCVALFGASAVLALADKLGPIGVAMIAAYAVMALVIVILTEVTQVQAPDARASRGCGHAASAPGRGPVTPRPRRRHHACRRPTFDA